MSKKNGENPDRVRRRLAQETARIIIEQGLRDYRSAKIKAAENLGMRNYGSLPRNEEIERAISEYLQLFGGKSHADFLVTIRSATLSTMKMLAAFEPRLVGAILSGNADPNSAIDLHLFSDSPEMVAMHLTELDVSYKPCERRLKSRRDQVDVFPGFTFAHEGAEVETTVFVVDGIRQAPISPIDGKPMKRADMKAVQELIKQE
jgi:hypothetical protein